MHLLYGICIPLVISNDWKRYNVELPDGSVAAVGSFLGSAGLSHLTLIWISLYYMTDRNTPPCVNSIVSLMTAQPFLLNIIFLCQIGIQVQILSLLIHRYLLSYQSFSVFILKILRFFGT